MKRSGLIALSLTLIMLLLVLGAAFIFLYQGRPVLERRVDALATESAALRQELALAEATVMVSEATRLAAGEALATAESDAVLLEGQLVASQQEADALATRVTELTAESEAGTDNRPEPTATATPGPPRVAIIAPGDGAVLAAGAAVNIVVAAADAAGITAVNLTIDDEAFRNYSVDEALLFTVSESWTPAGAGAFTLGAIAVNSHGLASETVTTTVTISPTAQTRLLSPTGEWRVAINQSPISNFHSLISNLHVIDDTDNDSPYRRLFPVKNLASAVAFVYDQHPVADAGLHCIHANVISAGRLTGRV